MALITIAGMNEDKILNAKTEPGGAGLRPFPCNASSWTRHTACVMKAGIRKFDQTGQVNISLMVCNGAYGGEVLINTDPSQVAPGLTPEKAAKQKENNLKTLTSIIKLLNAHTNGKLDTTKLEKAKGQCIEVIAKHKGFNFGNDGTAYHKVSLLYTGEVSDIQPVDESIGLPPLPGTMASATSGGFDDDLPL